MQADRNFGTGRFIVRPEAQKREPLPRGEVKIRKPKAAPKEPTKPSFASLLPSLMMGLFAVAIFFFQNNNGQGTLPLMAVPFLAASITLAVYNFWNFKRNLKKHEKEMAEREDDYRHYLAEVGDKLEAYNEQQQTILRQENPSASEMAKRVEWRSQQLWDRLPEHEDFLEVRIGTSAYPSTITIKAPEDDGGEEPLIQEAIDLKTRYAQVPDVPFVVNLNELGSIGLKSYERDGSLQLSFAMINHLVAHHSPDVVHLYLVSHRQDAVNTWQWLRWLPHTNVLRGHENGGSNRLSFSPETDDDVLSPLAKQIRQRIEEDQHVFRYGEVEPYTIVIFDETAGLRRHQLVQMLLSNRPEPGYNPMRACAIFIESPPPQVKGLITLQQDIFEYRGGREADRVLIQGRAEFMNGSRIEKLARLMAPMRTEASYNAAGGALPSSVRLVELLGATQPNDIDLTQLYSHQYDPRQVMSFPIGLNVDLKPQMVILREDSKGGYGHHAMLAGGTGKGKSVTLQSIVLSLAANNSPAHLNFVLADFKGGASELARLKNLPHVVGFVTDLDAAYVERFRLSLEGEVRRRKQILDETPKTLGHQIPNIYEYNKAAPENLMPHLIVVIDEFAKALQINPAFKNTLDKDIAAQGRALGIHLILSTQKAGDFTSVRQNIEVRMSMQVQTTEDSRIIFNRDDAAKKLTRAGQAYLQVGDNLIFEMFQVARADTPYAPEGNANLELLDEFSVNRVLPNGRRQMLYRHKAAKPEAAKAANKLIMSEAEVMVEHIRQYSKAHYGPARIICLPRLPDAEEMPLFELLGENPVFSRWQETGADSAHYAQQNRLRVPVGMLDLPQQQHQRPFFIDLNQRDGNYIVAGPTGSGKAFFLRTLVLGLAETHPPNELLFYFVSRGTTLTLFEELPHCQALIPPYDSERLMRLFSFLEEETTRRVNMLRANRKDKMASLRAARPDLDLPTLVVVFDDFADFIADFPERLNEIEGLASSAKQVDLHLVLSVSALRSVHPKIQQNMLNRLALGVKQQADTLEILGKRANPLPEIPGRGYTAEDQAVIECQIAAPSLTKGLNLRSPETNAEIRDIVAGMRDAWDWPDGKRPLPPIQGLPHYLELETLWQTHPKHALLYEQPTAVIGLEYKRLDPVWIEYNLLEPFNLVIGPPRSGKTEFLMTVALATATNIPPEQMDIVLFAFKPRHPMHMLRHLPHVRFARSAEQAEEILSDLQAELKERAVAQKDVANADQTVADDSTLVQMLPKRTLILIDDLQRFSRNNNLNKTLDDCVAAAGTGNLFVFLADTANNIDQIKQNYGIKYAQTAVRYGNGICFSADQNDLNTLSLMGRVRTQEIKIHAPQMSKGRGFWSYQSQVQVVQIARAGENEMSPEQYNDNIQRLVDDIAAKYPADAKEQES